MKSGTKQHGADIYNLMSPGDLNTGTVWRQDNIDCVFDYAKKDVIALVGLPVKIARYAFTRVHFQHCCLKAFYKGTVEVGIQNFLYHGIDFGSGKIEHKNYIHEAIGEAGFRSKLLAAAGLPPIAHGADDSLAFDFKLRTDYSP